MVNSELQKTPRIQYSFSQNLPRDDPSDNYANLFWINHCIWSFVKKRSPIYIQHQYTSLKTKMTFDVLEFRNIISVNFEIQLRPFIPKYRIRFSVGVNKMSNEKYHHWQVVSKGELKIRFPIRVFLETLRIAYNDQKFFCAGDCNVHPKGEVQH